MNEIHVSDELIKDHGPSAFDILLDDIDRAIEANTWREIAYGRMQSECRGDK